MALNLGGVIRLTYLVKNDSGVATNPTTATLTVTQPDGTVAAGTTITLPPTTTGLLVYDFTPSQAGLHAVHWATTVPTTAEDDVFVAEAPGRLLVSVDEAVTHLNASGQLTSDADREQLQWLCLVASEAVERELGRVFMRRTVVETHTGSGVLVLRSTPVLSVVSVTESGTALTASDYLLDSDAGILYRGSTSGAWSWAAGLRNVVVTYLAGFADPPKIVRKVALNAVQGMWQSSQQASHPLAEEFAESSVGAAVAALTPLERAAFESLRAPGIA